MDDLKKCPCCGGTPLVYDSDAHWKQVICKACGIRTPLMPDGEEAINIWNRREDQDRKRGRWERHYSRGRVYADLCWHCSVCGFASLYEWTKMYKICPECGTRMEWSGEE